MHIKLHFWITATLDWSNYIFIVYLYALNKAHFDSVIDGMSEYIWEKIILMSQNRFASITTAIFPRHFINIANWSRKSLLEP